MKLVDPDDELLGPDIIDEEAKAHDGVGEMLSDQIDYSGFVPTSAQKAFRKLSYNLVQKGKLFRREWFNATCPSRIKYTVTEETWKRWKKDDQRFVGWFYAEFPDVEGVSAEEFMMMDMKFWVGLRDSMSDGRSWAFKQYAAVRFKEAKDPDARWKTSEG